MQGKNLVWPLLRSHKSTFIKYSILITELPTDIL